MRQYLGAFNGSRLKKLEVNYEKKKNVSTNAVKDFVKSVGNSREKVEKKLKKQKGSTVILE